MKIQESSENYLERILMLEQKSGSVRSIDIARDMGFTKPSVSIAMKKLRENGYILVDEDGFITLTNMGRDVAESIYERHRVLTDMLVGLGVDEITARTDACRIEHSISDESFTKIKEHLRDKEKAESRGIPIAKE